MKLIGKASHGGEQDFELNLASIIDCFTVLIAYLLISASFVSLGSFDVSVSASSVEPTTAADAPKISLTIHLDKSGKLILALHGQQAGSFEVDPLPGTSTWDLDKAKGIAEGLKAKFPALDEATVTADPAVKYKEMVRAVGMIRGPIPKVYVVS